MNESESFISQNIAAEKNLEGIILGILKAFLIYALLLDDFNSPNKGCRSTKDIKKERQKEDDKS